MFKRFFNRNKPRLISKVDYWKRWEFFELFDDLHLAEQLLNQDIVPPNVEFENFKEQLIEEIYDIEGDNVANFTRIWEWFKPDHEWDAIIGTPGKELGIRIFYRADRWKRNQEFLPEAIVLLNGEVGVVLKNNVDSSLPGLIRWDTEKENDIEDWRGLFGSFLEIGGEVIEQNYKLKFINLDGTLKNNS